MPAERTQKFALKANVAGQHPDRDVAISAKDPKVSWFSKSFAKKPQDIQDKYRTSGSEDNTSAEAASSPSARGTMQYAVPEAEIGERTTAGFENGMEPTITPISPAPLPEACNPQEHIVEPTGAIGVSIDVLDNDVEGIEGSAITGNKTTGQAGLSLNIRGNRFGIVKGNFLSDNIASGETIPTVQTANSRTSRKPPRPRRRPAGPSRVF